MNKNEERAISARKLWLETFQQTNSVSITSRKCGVPRSTIYRWIERYQNNGIPCLKSLSRRPRRLAKLKINDSIENNILSLLESKKWGQ